jgi:large subunit ribosomal protein L18
MSEQTRKVSNSAQRATRTRATLHGTADKPRLSVHISNKNVSAQLINDDTSTTITAVSSVNLKSTGNLTEKSTAVGVEIAKKAKSNKISRVVFDRGSKKYHGRIKALADAARENGLEF